MASEASSGTAPTAIAAPPAPRDGQIKTIESLLATLNSVAQRVQTLWFSFISFGAYLTITVLGTTHRTLFLEEPVKLPVFNVDLPLTSFYFIAPGFFLIFHFYALIQLMLLARTASAFEAALQQSTLDEAEREAIRMRLDNSVFIQFICGPAPERRGKNAWLVRLIAILTMIVFPVCLLLLMQLQFLPYHHPQITGFHRWVITLDIVLLWLLWPAYSRGWGLFSLSLFVDTRNIRSAAASAARAGLRAAPAVFVLLVAWLIAVYPTEAHYANGLTRLPGRVAAALGEDARLSQWIMSFRNEPTSDWQSPSADPKRRRLVASFSFTELLLEPSVDYVTGAPTGFFSNTIVLPDKKFVDDDAVAKLDGIEASAKPGEFRLLRSFRGRDLAHAVLSRADLRRSDFTGANLDGANLEGAWLQRSRWSCADRGRTEIQMPFREEATETVETPGPQSAQSERAPADNCTRLRNARLQFARLQHAEFREAHAQGSDLRSAKLHDALISNSHFQKAVLELAELHATVLTRTNLQGARLDGAELHGASFDSVQMIGASADGAFFHGSSFLGVQLQGASLYGAKFHGAALNGAQMQGAILDDAEFHGTVLSNVELQGASLVSIEFLAARLDGTVVWRTRLSKPVFTATLLSDTMVDQKHFEQLQVVDFTKETFDDIRGRVGNELIDEKARERALGRLKRLEPSAPDPADWKDGKKIWTETQDNQKSDDEVKKARAEAIKEVACEPRSSAPYVAQGIVRSGVLTSIDGHAQLVIEALHHPEKCPGAKGLGKEDLARLETIERQLAGP